jgi:hypothetical protein
MAFINKDEHRKPCSFDKGDFRRRMEQGCSRSTGGLRPQCSLGKGAAEAE